MRAELQETWNATGWYLETALARGPVQPVYCDAQVVDIGVGSERYRGPNHIDVIANMSFYAIPMGCLKYLRRGKALCDQAALPGALLQDKNMVPNFDPAAPGSGIPTIWDGTPILKGSDRLLPDALFPRPVDRVVSQ